MNGLAKLMSEGHVFIDSAGGTVSGKALCLPGPTQHFERVLIAGTEAVIIGRSVCSDTGLAGPALWTARIEDGLVAEWRVYEDTNPNRARVASDS